MGEHNYEDVWKYALDQLHEEFKNAGRETEFKLWFNMTYVEDTLTTITVSVPSEFLWQSMLKKGNVQLVTKKIEELIYKTAEIRSKDGEYITGEEFK